MGRGRFFPGRNRREVDGSGFPNYSVHVSTLSVPKEDLDPVCCRDAAVSGANEKGHAHLKIHIHLGVINLAKSFTLDYPGDRLLDLTSGFGQRDQLHAGDAADYKLACGHLVKGWP